MLPSFQAHSTIKNGIETLEGFSHTIRFDVPYIITAIHAGSQIRSELKKYLVLSEREIHFEEDTATDLMIQGNPNTLWALDSRAQYDLNRTREQAVATKPAFFWGKQVYSPALPETLVEESLRRYDLFYEFISSAINSLVDRFGYCVIYDIHSYNISRQQAKGISAPPMFNLGTKLIGHPKWRRLIDAWLDCLKKVKISGFETTVAENEVFCGRKGLSHYVACNHDKALVLPTEISKFYMDEHTGILYEHSVEELRQQLSVAIKKHHSQFATFF